MTCKREYHTHFPTPAEVLEGSSSSEADVEDKTLSMIFPRTTRRDEGIFPFSRDENLFSMVSKSIWGT